MRSLNGKFLAIFALIALLNGAGTTAILLGIRQQKADGLVINLAGAQRMLSQQVAKEALMLGAGKGNRADLQKSISRFELVLDGLESGNSGLGLPRNESDQLRIQLS